jgi:TPR repeat protein
MKRTRISAALIATIAALAGCATEPAEAPPAQTTGTAAAPLSALPLSAAALAAYERGDHETAFREYSAFAEAGNATAQYGLGVMYERGEGTARDDAAAAGWYAKAAAQGFAEAQFTLAGAFEKGRGVALSTAEAASWYREAAEQGHVTAPYNLGLMYIVPEGRDRPEYRLQAAMWLHIAAARLAAADPLRRQALESFDAVTAEMTVVEFTEAERLAREWMKQHPQ